LRETYNYSGDQVYGIDWRGLYKVPVHAVDSDGDGIYDWDGEAIIRFKVKDYAGNVTYFEKIFYVDTTPPRITVTVDSHQFDPEDASTNPPTGWDETDAMQSYIVPNDVHIIVSSDDSLIYNSNNNLYNNDDLREVPLVTLEQDGDTPYSLTGKLLKTVSDTQWETDYKVLTVETTYDGEAIITVNATDIAGNTSVTTKKFLVDTQPITDDYIHHNIADGDIIRYSPDEKDGYDVIKIDLEDPQVESRGGMIDGAGVDEIATTIKAKVTWNGTEIPGTWDTSQDGTVTFLLDTAWYDYNVPSDIDRKAILKNGFVAFF
jgi:hypothetical protein